MPKIAEETRAARQGQIVAAALACFARTGYHATTMADVAAQAGVSKGTPYLYFDSKQALFLALHEEWDCGLADRVNVETLVFVVILCAGYGLEYLVAARTGRRALGQAGQHAQDR